MQNTAILILAAGSASRMGAIKQLLPYKNKSFIGWAIEHALESDSTKVFCILGANAEKITNQIKQYSITTIVNPNYKDGLSSSIVTGIKYLDDNHFDYALIMLADQPNVNAAYLNCLLKTSKKHPQKIIASNYKKNVGVPAIFPKKYFKDLKELKGDKGAKIFLQNHLSEVIKTKTIDLIDIDTKEEYQKLIEQS